MVYIQTLILISAENADPGFLAFLLLIRLCVGWFCHNVALR